MSCTGNRDYNKQHNVPFCEKRKRERETHFMSGNILFIKVFIFLHELISSLNIAVRNKRYIEIKKKYIYIIEKKQSSPLILSYLTARKLSCLLFTR